MPDSGSLGDVLGNLISANAQTGVASINANASITNNQLTQLVNDRNNIMQNLIAQGQNANQAQQIANTYTLGQAGIDVSKMSLAVQQQLGNAGFANNVQLANINQATTLGNTQLQGTNALNLQNLVNQGAMQQLTPTLANQLQQAQIAQQTALGTTGMQTAAQEQVAQTQLQQALGTAGLGLQGTLGAAQYGAQGQIGAAQASAQPGIMGAQNQAALQQAIIPLLQSAASGIFGYQPPSAAATTAAGMTAPVAPTAPNAPTMSAYGMSANDMATLQNDQRDGVAPPAGLSAQAANYQNALDSYNQAQGQYNTQQQAYQAQLQQYQAAQQAAASAPAPAAQPSLISAMINGTGMFANLGGNKQVTTGGTGTTGGTSPVSIPNIQAAPQLPAANMGSVQIPGIPSAPAIPNFDIGSTLSSLLGSGSSTTGGGAATSNSTTGSGLFGPALPPMPQYTPEMQQQQISNAYNTNISSRDAANLAASKQYAASGMAPNSAGLIDLQSRNALMTNAQNEQANTQIPLQAMQFNAANVVPYATLAQNRYDQGVSAALQATGLGITQQNNLGQLQNQQYNSQLGQQLGLTNSAIAQQGQGMQQQTALAGLGAQNYANQLQQQLGLTNAAIGQQQNIMQNTLGQQQLGVQSQGQILGLISPLLSSIGGAIHS